MFSNWKTFALLLPCALAAVAGIYLIYVDTFGTATTGLGKPVARIVSCTSEARRKPASSYLWTRAATNMAVYLNDAIQTGEGGHATLELTDGSRVEVGPDAMLLIDESLVHGEKTPPGKTLAAEHPVTLPHAPVAAATTPVPPPPAPLKPPRQPAAPRVAVKPPPPRIARAERTPEPQYVPPAPTPSPEPLSERVLSLESPGSNERIAYPPGQPVPFLFSWEIEPAVSRRGYFYLVELAQDYSFASPLARLRTRESGVSSQKLNVPAGTFYWRVRIVDGNNHILRQSAIQRFSYGPFPRRRVANAPEPVASPGPSPNRGLSAPTHIKVHIE